jgi:hypothetical protein
MPPTITDWRSFDFEKHLLFEDARQNSHRGFSMRIQVRNGDKAIDMYHQTPVLRMPFGIGSMEGDYGKKYEATFSFPGYVHDPDADDEASFPGDPEIAEYHKFLHQWDEFNLDLATSKTQDWFKKKYSKEVIKELYKYQLKESSDPTKYSKLFRTKVPFKYDEFGCNFYGADGKVIPAERVVKGTKVVALIKTTGMWFAGKGFGVTHQVEQFMVMEEESFDTCAISINGGVPDVVPHADGSIFNRPSPTESPSAKRPRTLTDDRVGARGVVVS